MQLRAAIEDAKSAGMPGAFGGMPDDAEEAKEPPTEPEAPVDDAQEMAEMQHIFQVGPRFASLHSSSVARVAAVHSPRGATERIPPCRVPTAAGYSFARQTLRRATALAISMRGCGHLNRNVCRRS